MQFALPLSSRHRAALFASLILAILALIGSPERSAAVSEIRLAIGTIDGGTWKAEDVVIRLLIGADAKTVAHVSATRMTLPAGAGSVEGLAITCPEPIVSEPQFRCKRAQVSGKFTQLGAQRFVVEGGYNSETQKLDVAVAGLKVGKAEVKASAISAPKGWELKLDTGALAISSLQKLVSPWMPAPEGLTADGRASFHVIASGLADAVSSLDVKANIEELTANNAEGTIATDKLGLQIDAQVRSSGKDWAIEGSLRSDKGQAYSEPVFVDFGQYPLASQFVAHWRGANKHLSLERMTFDQKAVAKGTARGELDFAGETLLSALELDLDAVQFPGAYLALFQPFLLSTELKDLTTSGTVSGTVEIAKGLPAAIDLRLENLTAQDKAGKLAIEEMRGHVVWYSSEARAALPANTVAPESRMQWKSAHLYGLTGGPASIRFEAAGADFRVLEPTTLPVFDGGLAINTLVVRNFGTPELLLRFDAELQPISMALLSQAFGWPTLGGKIAGRIPNVTLEERVLKLGGDLQAQVFGGSVVINQMQLRDPLGSFPRLSANIILRNLDLEAVTGTFSFGTITGRLDGDVKGLELFGWKPTRFDVRLYTPAKDKSKHLISQRAVNNLSNIGGGGGVGAALQNSFMKFFDNFRYDRLGISCRLENEVCYMDGVAPASGTSYYIVKGSGVPRIDIIGNAHRVSWNRLLGQLLAIQESGGPVVK